MILWDTSTTNQVGLRESYITTRNETKLNLVYESERNNSLTFSSEITMKTPFSRYQLHSSTFTSLYSSPSTIGGRFFNPTFRLFRPNSTTTSRDLTRRAMGTNTCGRMGNQSQINQSRSQCKHEYIKSTKESFGALCLGNIIVTFFFTDRQRECANNRLLHLNSSYHLCTLWRNLRSDGTLLPF